MTNQTILTNKIINGSAIRCSGNEARHGKQVPSTIISLNYEEKE